MRQDVALRDVISGHQAYIQREKDIAFCIWLRPRAVNVMHARSARDEIINLLRENYYYYYHYHSNNKNNDFENMST